MKNKFYIGCVADDFTGAGDVASFFVKAGLVTVLYNGIPDDSHTVAEGTQAVVIALKSRTQDREQAVADSLRAFGWLLQEGARKLYFKYCSTFDSTKEGNIGPVADAKVWLPIYNTVSRASGQWKDSRERKALCQWCPFGGKLHAESSPDSHAGVGTWTAD